MDPQTLRDLPDPTDGSLEELADRYHQARRLAIEFADIADEIELELAARMADDEVPVTGVGVLVRRVERRSTWRDEHASADFRRDVGTAVVRKVSLDIATGELDPVKRNIAQVTVETMYDVIPAFSSIKRPGYRLGLDPKDYRSVSDVYRVTVDDGEERNTMTTESADLHMEAHLAFYAALGSVEDIVKTETADTGKYTYTYANLPAVLEEVKRACELHGLALTQTPTAGDGMLELYTRLIHKNGGEVNFEPIRLPLPKEAQPFGSALTYLRRYALLTIFGIATEDDDGKAATVAAQTSPGRRTEAERMIRESMGSMDEAMRTRFIADFKTAFGATLTDLPAARHGDALTWSREWADEAPADEPSTGQQEQAADDLDQTGRS